MKDNRTHGYVIIHSETGERIGGVYHSTGGAKNSFNRLGYWNGHVYLRRHFQTQSEYVLKRLVIADE